MHVERISTRGRGQFAGLPRGCGLIAIIAAVAILLLTCGALLMPAVPGIVLQSVGFREVGSTDDLFTQVTPAPTLIAAPLVDDAPPRVLVNAGTLGQRHLPAQDAGYTLQTTADDALMLTLTETGVLALCRQYGDVCDGGLPDVRNVTIDFRSGGGIVRADVRLPDTGIWQQVGAVLVISGPTQLDLAGVDVNGTTYSAPSGEIGDLVAEAGRVLNETLSQLTIQQGLRVYRLREIYAHDDAAVLILR